MKKNKLQPRIMGIVGSMGSGKTLFMSAIAEKLKNDYLVLANYKLDCRDYDITPERIAYLMEDLLKYKKHKKLMFIDEFHIFSDSRMSSSHHNILMSYFITQTRKQDIQLVYSTQQLGQVDIRVRDNTDVIALPQYNKVKDLLTVRFYKRAVMSTGFIYHDTIKYTNLKPVFNVYNTEQLIGEDMMDRIKTKLKNND